MNANQNSVRELMQSLGRRITRLERAVDSAYEADAAYAEELDAQLAELREQLTYAEADWEECEEGGDLEALEYHEGVGVEEQLIRAYAEYLRPVKYGQFAGARASVISHMRSVIEDGIRRPLMASDEAILEAAKDAYENEIRRRARRRRKLAGGAPLKAASRLLQSNRCRASSLKANTPKSAPARKAALPWAEDGRTDFSGLPESASDAPARNVRRGDERAIRLATLGRGS